MIKLKYFLVAASFFTASAFSATASVEVSSGDSVVVGVVSGPPVGPVGAGVSGEVVGSSEGPGVGVSSTGGGGLLSLGTKSSPYLLTTSSYLRETHLYPAGGSSTLVFVHPSRGPSGVKKCLSRMKVSGTSGSGPPVGVLGGPSPPPPPVPGVSDYLNT